MGSYSPSLIFDEALEDEIREKILAPTYEGFKADGLDFRGVLFIGLMITEDGPKVIEFNNRFGDPETQAILPRLRSDLLDIFLAVAGDRLASLELRWSKARSVCVVLAAGGYPGDYEKGKPIDGLALADDDALVFHAGTAFGAESREILTAGGRVLGVTALGATHEEARDKAYANAARIRFDGVRYRRDIGILKEV
jgi:phosphoribosylamine--glycine ligase